MGDGFFYTGFFWMTLISPYYTKPGINSKIINEVFERVKQSLLYRGSYVLKS